MILWCVEYMCNYWCSLGNWNSINQVHVPHSGYLLHQVNIGQCQEPFSPNFAMCFIPLMCSQIQCHLHLYTPCYHCSLALQIVQYQERMSRTEGGKGASNYVKHLLSNPWSPRPYLDERLAWRKPHLYVGPAYVISYAIVLDYVWLHVHPNTVYDHLLRTLTTDVFAHATGVGRSFAAFGGSCAPAICVLTTLRICFLYLWDFTQRDGAVTLASLGVIVAQLHTEWVNEQGYMYIGARYNTCTRMVL